MTESTRIFLLLAEGAKAEILHELITQGKLPHLQALYPQAESKVPKTLASLPAATGPGTLSYLLGRSPGSLNIPGTTWFDRMAYVNRAPRRTRSRRYDPGSWGHVVRDIEGKGKTLFELVPEHENLAQPIRRGVAPERDHLAGGNPLRRRFIGAAGLDRRAVHGLSQAATRGARLVVAMFHAIHERTLRYGLRAPQTMEAYEILDYAVESLLGVLKERNQLDTTRILLTSSTSPTDIRKSFALSRLLKAKKYGRKRARLCITGSALAHLHLPKRGEWKQRPRGAPLWAEHGELLYDLAHHADIAFIAYRDEVGNVVVQKGDHRVRLFRREDSVEVLVEGGPVLELDRDLHKVPHDRFFEATWTRHYPDVAHQLAQLFESPRCGDVLIEAEPGVALDPGRDKVTYGSLHRAHALVPLLINEPGLVTGPTRAVDVYATILDRLNRRWPPEVEGRPLASTAPTPPSPTNGSTPPKESVPTVGEAASAATGVP